jgi:hypothetical protein
MKNATKPQRFTNRATSSKIMWTTSISTDDQSGEPTLGQWPQCYRVWNEIDIFKVSDNILNYALNHQCNRL